MDIDGEIFYEVYEREKSESTPLDHHTCSSVSVFARISV